jgi:enamine deaminase RidA (YjgF/YER057c/UK114 family)
MGNCTSIDKTFYCVGRSGTTKQALEEIKQDLAANKLSMNDVVSTNVYLEDINEFAAMNKIYATYFPGVKPTRTTVQPYKKVAELSLAPTTGAEAKPDDSPRAQISVVAVRQ